jgi:hypothetical protein
MKAYLKFDLDDKFQSVEFTRCTKSLDLVLALDNFTQRLRSRLKHGTLTTEQYDEADLIRSWFYQELEDRGVNLDELII